MENRVDQLLRSTSNYLGKIQCDATRSTTPFKCAVDTCKNKFISLESHKLSTFKFHNFPRQHVFNQTWKAYCNLAPGASTILSKICSDHFTLDDYERNLKVEFLNPELKRRLKDSALPSVNVSADVTEEKLNEYIKFKLKTPDTDLSVQADTDLSVRQDSIPIPPFIQSNTELKGKKQDKVLEESRIPHKRHKLYEESLTLTNDIKSLRKKIKYARCAIGKRKSSILASKKYLKIVNGDIQKRIKKILRSFLSDTQINLLEGKTKVYWTDDDLAQAFSLRHMGGKDFYLYMKNTLNYPLPSLSCVQAWAGN